MFGILVCASLVAVLLLPPFSVCRNGTKYTNAIDLGSGTAIVQDGDSSMYLDTSLSGNGSCHFPDSYGNQTIGDGGDVVR